jgi:hypothetical protein
MPTATLEHLATYPNKIVQIWDQYDRARAAVPAAKTERERLERDRELQALEGERDRQLRSVDEETARAIAYHEWQNRQALARDSVPGTEEVADAWTNRIRGLLDSGVGVAEILRLRGLDRAGIAALRTNLGSYLIARAGPDAIGDVERQIPAALEAVREAEIRLMPDGVREAAIAERDRERVGKALAIVEDRYSRPRRNGWQPSPQEKANATMSLAYATAEALDRLAPQADRDDWKRMVYEIDPEGMAKAERGSLSLDQREALDRNARTGRGTEWGASQPFEDGPPEQPLDLGR